MDDDHVCAIFFNRTDHVTQSSDGSQGAGADMLSACRWRL